MTDRANRSIILRRIARQTGDGRDDIGGQQGRIAGALAIEGRQLHRRAIGSC
jgi:hypothetical protein